MALAQLTGVALARADLVVMPFCMRPTLSSGTTNPHLDHRTRHLALDSIPTRDATR
jgi:hypothetical protein